MRSYFRQSPAAAYGLAGGSFLAALVVRFAIGRWMPAGFPFLTFFPAVVLSAYFCGRWPAILVAAASGLAAWYFFIPPVESFALDRQSATALALFIFVVAVDIFFVDGMATALARLEDERERAARLADSRDLLARELHHRVSNNIQVVASLLRLQSDQVADAQARRALGEAGQRVNLIANIQRNLHTLDGGALSFRDFAEQLMADALAAAGAGRITYRVEGGAEPLPSDRSTPVALVLLECVNNALEHGFVPGGSGSVQVRLDQGGDEHVLTVIDDGGGPPPGFDPARARSLGLRIVKAMAGQLGGAFSIVREGDVTVCTLRYPAAL